MQSIVTVIFLISIAHNIVASGQLPEGFTVGKKQSDTDAQGNVERKPIITDPHNRMMIERDCISNDELEKLAAKPSISPDDQKLLLAHQQGHRTTSLFDWLQQWYINIITYLSRK